MKLFLANIHEITTEHIPLISPERAEKAQRYRFSADKKRCVAGGLLLRRFLGDAAIYTDPFGKPRAESGVCFNLSHSGDWVLLAVSDKEIGCDIERLRQVEARTQAPDHPILWSAAESSYLKFYIFQVVKEQ